MIFSHSKLSIMYLLQQTMPHGTPKLNFCKAFVTWMQDFSLWKLFCLYFIYLSDYDLFSEEKQLASQLPLEKAHYHHGRAATTIKKTGTQ